MYCFVVWLLIFVVGLAVTPSGGSGGTYTPNPNNYSTNYNFSDLFGNATTPANNTSTPNSPNVVSPSGNGWHPNMNPIAAINPLTTSYDQWGNPVSVPAGTKTTSSIPKTSVPSFNYIWNPSGFQSSNKTMAGNASGSISSY